MIALVEGAKRQKTPNEIALTILLSGLTIIFLLAVSRCGRSPCTRSRIAADRPLDHARAGAGRAAGLPDPDDHRRAAERHRHQRHGPLVQRNVLATSGRAVEAAGDVDVLLLDKTGTITLGNRMATAFHPRRASTRRNWPTPRNLARWPTRRRKGAPSSCWPRSASGCAGAGAGRAARRISCPSPRRRA
jgi:K+-transporting ATPase ATPase B chain